MIVDFVSISTRATAVLVRRFGASHIDDIEDAVQDAIAAALRTWPTRGKPDEPAAWVLTVARNRVLDRLKTVNRLVDLAEDFPAPNDAFGDDELRLLMLCCHPSINELDQIAVTLRIIAGFGNRQIARAFLMQESAIAQRIVRAKAKLRQAADIAEWPPEPELMARLRQVQRTIYLMFSEGYVTTEGAAVSDLDLAETAISLLERLMTHPIGRDASCHALMALLCFSRARMPARYDDGGRLLTLDVQDRSKFDSVWIDAGLRHLDASTAARRPSIYHYLAGIAADNTIAASFESVRWDRVCEQYEDLLRLEASAIYEVGLAIAGAMLHGTEWGLSRLDQLTRQDFSAAAAAKAWILRRAGLDSRSAAIRAAELTSNVAEREFLLSF